MFKIRRFSYTHTFFTLPALSILIIDRTRALAFGRKINAYYSADDGNLYFIYLFISFGNIYTLQVYTWEENNTERLFHAFRFVHIFYTVDIYFEKHFCCWQCDKQTIYKLCKIMFFPSHLRLQKLITFFTVDHCKFCCDIKIKPMTL